MEESSRLEEVREGWWRDEKAGIGCVGVDSLHVEKGKCNDISSGFVSKTLRIVHYCRASQMTSTYSEGLNIRKRETVCVFSCVRK